MCLTYLVECDTCLRGGIRGPRISGHDKVGSEPNVFGQTKELATQGSAVRTLKQYIELLRWEFISMNYEIFSFALEGWQTKITMELTKETTTMWRIQGIIISVYINRYFHIEKYWPTNTKTFLSFFSFFLFHPKLSQSNKRPDFIFPNIPFTIFIEISIFEWISLWQNQTDFEFIFCVFSKFLSQNALEMMGRCWI